MLVQYIVYANTHTHILCILQTFPYPEGLVLCEYDPDCCGWCSHHWAKDAQG